MRRTAESGHVGGRRELRASGQTVREKLGAVRGVRYVFAVGMTCSSTHLLDKLYDLISTGVG